MNWLKRLVKIGSIGAIVAIVVVGGLVIFSTVLHNKTVILPAPTGPYAVGRVAYDWVDKMREDRLAQERGRKRELMAWVWYPAGISPSTEFAVTLPDPWGHVREQDWGLLSFLMQRPASIRGHAVTDAALSSAQVRYPLLIWLPGLGPLASDYSALAEELASHGYVVMAITPTYSASIVVFADGRAARATPAGNIPDTPMSVAEEKRLGDQLMQVWAADARFTMDQAEQLNTEPKSRFGGRLDLTRIGLFGHSFGGATAAQACRLDNRCKAALDLDGYPFGDVVQVGLQQPLMFIWSETVDKQDLFYQQATRDSQAILANGKNGGYQLTIKGARHFNFTDLAVLYAPVIKAMGLLGPIDGARGLKIAR
ncbi:MAG: hypothetical protein NT075_25455, partial [Chloroflexi bacterium]|nr:hypothetical protein [Chloroflexota bacterium]